MPNMKKFDIPEKLEAELRKPSVRKKMLAKCGATAFLDPENLRYPVKNPETCKFDFRLIHAAYVRSRQLKHNKITHLAKQLLLKMGYNPEEH